MNYNSILVKKEKGIGFITLNSPKTFNGLSTEMATEILDSLKALRDDDEVKVLVISGNGPGFCAGGDLKTMMHYIENGDVATDYFEPVLDILSEIVLTIKKMRKPVIASIHKAAAGAGFNFALACDFRIASENAVFVQSFVNLGLIPDMGGLYFLTKYLGPHIASELAMLGTVVTSLEAYDLGLVTRVVEDNDLEKETIAFAQQFVKGPTLAYASMKEILYNNSFSDLEDYLKDESKRQVEAVRTEDFLEGAKAFVEKRDALFKGK